jgi:hypothetical protein
MGKETPIMHFWHAAWSGIFFLLVSSYSIGCTESWINGGNGRNVRPSISVFWQPYDIWNGVYAGRAAVAILIAFVLWFIWTGIAFYFEAYKMHLNAMHKGAGGTFITVAGLLVTADSYANWISVSTWNIDWYWQAVISIGIALVLMYLGHFCITHLLKGLQGMKGQGA